MRDLSTFQCFVRLCAGRVGQLLNLHSLGNDAGVSHTTARQWISVLEASSIVFLLPPLHANVSKRLIKTPKLYSHDVGLASRLLGIENTRQLETHPLRGALVENLAIADVVKVRSNTVRRINLLFYRDSGLEVDLVYPIANRYLPIEIKAGQTFSPAHLHSLEKFAALFPTETVSPMLVYGGEETFMQGGISVLPVRSLADGIAEIEAAEA